MEKQEEQPLLLSVPQAARLLNLCDRTVWDLIADRQLRSKRVGRRVLIPRTSVEQFVESAS
jgi:excisionase family DNA binding protein